MKAFRRSRLARPRSFLAFFHDRSSRCRAARMVSRQQRRPNRACTLTTRRLSVQRGAGSAPATGGAAAPRWAARTSSPSVASISGQRGDGHQCGNTAAPRGRVRYSYAPSPLRFAGGAPYVRPPAWRSRLGRCRAEQGSARGCGHAARSGPCGGGLPASGSSAHDQLVTSVLTIPSRGSRHMGMTAVQPSKTTMGLELDVV